MWKIKLGEDGKPVVRDGLPVFTNDKDDEVTGDDISRMLETANSESATRRRALKKLEEELGGTKTTLGRFQEYGSPEELAEKLSLLSELQDSKDRKEGNLDEVLEREREEAKKELRRVQSAAKERETGFEAQVTELNETIQHLLIDSKLSVALKGRVRGGDYGAQDAVSRIKGEGVIQLEGKGSETRAFVEGTSGQIPIEDYVDTWLKGDVGKNYALGSRAEGGHTGNEEQKGSKPNGTSNSFDPSTVRFRSEVKGTKNLIAFEKARPGEFENLPSRPPE
ncbi:MAG: hypothetical protein K0U98_11380 [Deltaproteobacteria bacterium]|nr:hypothetical protein [Deltaproteobacteria bacterium]